MRLYNFIRILKTYYILCFPTGIFSAVAMLVLVAVRDGGNIKVMNLEEFLEGVIGHRDASSSF